jgi:hypothetical protein
MAAKAYLDRVKGAGADVAKDDPQGADDQDMRLFCELMAHIAWIFWVDSPWPLP